MHWIVLITVAALTAACVANDAPTRQPETTAAAIGRETTTPSPAIITTLQTRSQRLRIYAGGTFDLLDADGNLIAADLSEAELEREHPDAHATYRQAIADGVVPVTADLAPPETPR